MREHVTENSILPVTRTQPTFLPSAARRLPRRPTGRQLPAVSPLSSLTPLAPSLRPANADEQTSYNAEYAHTSPHIHT